MMGVEHKSEPPLTFHSRHTLHRHTLAGAVSMHTTNCMAASSLMVPFGALRVAVQLPLMPWLTVIEPLSEVIVETVATTMPGQVAPLLPSVLAP
jgi:hypothetical protein